MGKGSDGEHECNGSIHGREEMRTSFAGNGYVPLNNEGVQRKGRGKTGNFGDTQRESVSARSGCSSGNGCSVRMLTVSLSVLAHNFGQSPKN